MPAQKRKRTDFTLKEKEIIDAAKEPNQSKLAREMSKNWGVEVNRTTVKGILSKKDAIEAAIKAGVPSKRMKLTQAHNPKLDKGRFPNPRYNATLVTMPLLLGPDVWHSNEI